MKGRKAFPRERKEGPQVQHALFDCHALQEEGEAMWEVPRRRKNKGEKFETNFEAVETGRNSQWPEYFSGVFQEAGIAAKDAESMRSHQPPAHNK